MDSSNEGAEIEIPTCSNCLEPQTSPYLECAECTKKNVLLCYQCFSLGAELGSSHKRTHNYRVKAVDAVPLFSQQHQSSSSSSQPTTSVASCSRWSSREEVALLKAVEKYNMGNWEEVAKHVNPSRTVADVKSHYDMYYLRGRIGHISTRGFRRPVIEDESADYGQINTTPGGTSHFASTSVARPPQPTPHSQMSPPIRQSVCKVNSDDLLLLAYMPLRDDFEKEWHNDAEDDVSTLLPGADDDQLDREVKSTLIDSYVSVTTKRRQLKALARDYDLVPEFLKKEKPVVRSMQLDRTYAKMKRMEEELRDDYKRFAQFVTASEFNELIAGLMKEQRLKERVIEEQRLKQRVDELQELKRDGVTVLEGRAANFSVDSPKRKFKRGRKRIMLNHTARKANHRWQRLQRWQKKLLDE